MASTQTKTLLTVVALLAAGAVGVLAWRSFSPPVKDSYFQLNYMYFQTVPKNLLVVRPTHFTYGPGSVTASTSPKPGLNIPRMVGRDVPLEQVMATAYGCSPDRVVAPIIKPKGNFDFLVTVPDRQQERFQAAIKKELGYVAHWEDRDTDVLRLETISPDPPAFKVSAASNGNVSRVNGTYQFTHMRPAFIAGVLESNFKQPVLDRTGLTNFYDFSVTMNWHGPKGPDRQQLEAILTNLGLKLEPATESVPMLVVQESH